MFKLLSPLLTKVVASVTTFSFIGLFAWLKGRKDVIHTYTKKQNETLKSNAGLSDRALADKLRQRAKRKDRNKRGR